MVPRAEIKKVSVWSAREGITDSALSSPEVRDGPELGIEPDRLLMPFVAIFHSLPGRNVLGFRP
jgi:hypothetical protein